MQATRHREPLTGLGVESSSGDHGKACGPVVTISTDCGSCSPPVGHDTGPTRMDTVSHVASARCCTTPTMAPDTDPTSVSIRHPRHGREGGLKSVTGWPLEGASMADDSATEVICNWPDCRNHPTTCMSAVIEGSSGLFYLCDVHANKLRRGQRFACGQDGVIRTGFGAKMKGRCVVDSFWSMHD